MAFINYNNIIFLLAIVLINKSLSLQINEIEKDLKVMDELSRIAQIKSISNEIKDKASRKNCQETNQTKSIGKSMKIKSDLFIKGNITCGNILVEEITITKNVIISKTTSSNQINANKVSSQTIIVNELRSPTVFIFFYKGCFNNKW